MPIYDVNTKAAAAMINSGLSASGTQKYMSTIEVRPVTAKTLKRHEREIGMKVAASGLCYQHLKLAFARNGEEGIRALFSEKNKWKCTCF